MKKEFVIFLLGFALAVFAFDELSTFRGEISDYGFSVPMEDEVTFVASQGGDLGHLHYRSDGPIEFKLLVNRYFGDVVEREIQLSRRLLGPTLDLYIPAVDVDYDEGVLPERDKVFFNDHEVGTLWGKNDKVSMNHFSVPFKYVNFPKHPGEVGVNKIRIMVDVLSNRDNWYTSIPWAALTISAPRPVVMVHGWQSDGSVWGEMQEKLSTHLGLPAIAVNLGADDCVSTNAITLWGFLEEMRKDWHVQEVNIIAHSKGGLDSRHLTHPNGENDQNIPYLKQIATPNGGSRLAWLVGNREFFTKDLELLTNVLDYKMHFSSGGLFALRPDVCAQFNKCFPVATSNAKVNVIAGRVSKLDGRALGLLQKIAWFCYGHNDSSDNSKRWGDGIVSVPSAHTEAAPVGASPLHSEYAWHCDLPQKLAFQCLRTFEQDLVKVKKATYRGPSSEQKTRSVREPVSRLLRPLPSEQEKTEVTTCHDNGDFWSGAGLVQPGRVEGQGFDNLAEQRLFLSFLGIPADVVVTLTFPDGKTVNSRENAEEFHFLTAEEAVDDAFASLFAGIHWEGEVPAGHCEYRIDGGNLEEPLFYRVLLTSDSPEATLNVALMSDSICCDNPLQLCAQVTGAEDGLPLPDTTVSLTVSRGDGDGQPVRVSFRDDGEESDSIAGDGVFSCSFLPQQAGIYILSVSSESRLSSGLIARRHAETLVCVTSSNCRILDEIKEQPRDNDFDGVYDSLDFLVTIDVPRPTTCTLLGVLQSPGGQVIATASCRHLTLWAGLHQVNLSFHGQQIFESGIDGPYHLAGLVLTELDSDDVMPLHSPDWTFETADYSRWDFVHPPYSLCRTDGDNGTDIGLDTDNDGRIDVIRYFFTIEVAPDAPLDCQWQASLEDKDTGLTIVNAQQTGTLVPDSDHRVTLSLDFPCETLQTARVPNSSFIISGLQLGPLDGLNTFLDVYHETQIYCFTLADASGAGEMSPTMLSGNLTLIEGDSLNLNPFHLLLTLNSEDNFSAATEFAVILSLPENVCFLGAEWNGKDVSWLQDGNLVALCLTGRIPRQDVTLFCELMLDDVLPKDMLHISADIDYAEQAFSLAEQHKVSYNLEITRILNLQAGHWYALTLDSLPTRESVSQLLDQRPFLFSADIAVWKFASQADLLPGTSLVFYAQNDDTLFLSGKIPEPFPVQNRGASVVWDFGQGKVPPLYQLDEETGRFLPIPSPQRDYSSSGVILDYPTWSH